MPNRDWPTNPESIRLTDVLFAQPRMDASATDEGVTRHLIREEAKTTRTAMLCIAALICVCIAMSSTAILSAIHNSEAEPALSESPSRTGPGLGSDKYSSLANPEPGSFAPPPTRAGVTSRPRIKDTP